MSIFTVVVCNRNKNRKVEKEYENKSTNKIWIRPCYRTCSFTVRKNGTLHKRAEIGKKYKNEQIILAQKN